MTIPYHIPSLPKPQKQYNFQVDNTNYNPFRHRLPESIHPASNFSPLAFAYSYLPSPPTQPSSLESTPSKFIQTAADMNYLATKLRDVDEFAVDLEHNSYRSFQGITCLMQISTRSEDFVVDTLKLREHIGPCLGEYFLDPNKRKVMHGASNDILWLQRDFGIYVCNLFDTMQASRALNLERNSLEYLLNYYCGVTANKQYQASDWRLRPLPHDMIKYAREDTHYLLYIKDLMLNKIESDRDIDDSLFVEVFTKSHEVSVQLYEKEVFNPAISYLKLYGLSEANLDVNQLGVVAALYEWRDGVAREEDESTGYVLPNKMLLEIGKRLPLNKEELLEVAGHSKEFVIRDADIIIARIQYMINGHAAWKFGEVIKLLNQKVDVVEIAEKIITEARKNEYWRQQHRMWNYQCSVRRNCVYIPVHPLYVSY